VDRSHFLNHLQRSYARRSDSLASEQRRASLMRDPQTPIEWQTAVDAAEANLVLDAARQYGLVKGGPGVNVERCQEILRRGALKGIVPAADCAERYASELMSQGRGGGR
jgi:hypothetical protein